MEIDFHAHILPGADHGSDGIETSLRQVAMAADAGVDLVVATPHFYPDQDTVDRFLRRREACYEKLRRAMGSSTRPQILLGAEVTICPGLERMGGLSQLCVEGTKVMLLEMPMGPWRSDLLETIGQIQNALKLTVVLAHVDRYNRQPVDQLLRLGVRCQLNAEGTLPMFGRSRYREIMASGSCVALGSDIHGTRIGYRKYRQAREIYCDLWGDVMRSTEKLIATKANTSEE